MIVSQDKRSIKQAALAGRLQENAVQTVLGADGTPNAAAQIHAEQINAGTVLHA